MCFIRLEKTFVKRSIDVVKCPKCGSVLEKKMYKGIEVDYCSNSKGMWLDAKELDELEDQAYDQDEYKGSLFVSSAPTEYPCPHCGQPLKRFQYRINSLELEYCENGHGFWLDEGEAERVLELMESRAGDIQRKFEAEAEWYDLLNKLRSKSIFRRF
jgi:Zn-finger nucleic acid-binding protein